MEIKDHKLTFLFACKSRNFLYHGKSFFQNCQSFAILCKTSRTQWDQIIKCMILYLICFVSILINYFCIDDVSFISECISIVKFYEKKFEVVEKKKIVIIRRKYLSIR